MNLHLKYRPTTFEEVKGNENVLESLQGALLKESRPHSYLLHGPTGCGKTTVGRIIAKELGAVGHDFKEIDSADFRGIDTIRSIRQDSRLAPMEGPCRVFLIDECHKLTNDAQNAILKTLEDTPSHVYFILCTTDPQKLITTIRGRCSQFQLHPLPYATMMKLLREVVRAEGETLSKKIYEQIVQDSLGLPRNALQILGKVLSVPEKSRQAVADEAAESNSKVLDLCRALMQGVGWGIVASRLKEIEEEPETVRRAVLGYCEAVLMNRSDQRAGKIMYHFQEPFYNTGKPGLVYACYAVVEVENN